MSTNLQRDTRVTLLGVAIPHEFGLEGHSDADAPMHALTDAILGAIGEADIGAHFPPTDPQWRGAELRLFLEHAVSLVEAKGGVVAHVDITLLAEAPKIAPHIAAMKERLGPILHLDATQIGIKATTTETLGFVGRREGIAAFATATVRLPAREAVAMMDDRLLTLAASVLDLCRAKQLQIAAAESCTGGLVCAALTAIAGSSDVFDRGFVTYSNDAKRDMLGVSAEILEQYGAVSRECALAMAEGALNHSRASICLLHYRYCRPGRRNIRQTSRSRAHCLCRRGIANPP